MTGLDIDRGGSKTLNREIDYKTKNKTWKKKWLNELHLSSTFLHLHGIWKGFAMACSSPIYTPMDGCYHVRCCRSDWEQLEFSVLPKDTTALWTVGARIWSPNPSIISSQHTLLTEPNNYLQHLQ